MRCRSLILCMAALLVSFSGCGGCGGKPQSSGKWGGMSKKEWLKQYQEKLDKDAQEEAEAQKKAEAAKKATAAKRTLAGSARKHLVEGTTPGQARPPAHPGIRRQPNKPEKPPELPPLLPLPESFAEWTEHDYINAKAAAAPVFPAAIKYLGEECGDERAAALLAELLKPLQQDGPAGGNRPSRHRIRTNAGKLIEVIVAALGTNKTQHARQTLSQLVSGHFETDDNRVAASAAVRALVENPCPENEEILFGILTSEQTPQPSAAGSVPSKELRKLAYSLLGPVASSRLRLRVAHWLVESAASDDSREDLSDLVDRIHPEGLEAHVFLLVNDHTPAEKRADVMEQFAGYSSQALAGLFGIPQAEGDDSAAASGWPRRVIGQLWSPRFCSFLEGALGEVSSLDNDRQPLALAGTVPADSVRAALYETLRMHWTDGPRILESAGFTKDLVGDPGLLLMAQMLVYEEIPVAKRNLAMTGVSLVESVDHRKTAYKAWKGKLGKAADEWQEFLENSQTAICRRLLAAASHRQAPRAAPGLADDPLAALSYLPLELHTDARVVAAYHLDWAGKVRKAIAPVAADPMEICYVRIEEQTRQAKMLGTYRRRLRPCCEREVDGGLVLEALQDASRQGRKRAVAVRIMQAMPEIPRLPTEEQPMIVEILSVEMNDPADPRWKTADLIEN